MGLSACCLRVFEVILGSDDLPPLALVVEDAGVAVLVAPEGKDEIAAADGMERQGRIRVGRRSQNSRALVVRWVGARRQHGYAGRKRPGRRRSGERGRM